MKYAACLFVAFACVLLVSIGCSSTDDVINTPPVRFVDNGNGTVTDTQMGLIWLKSASCLGGKNWVDANAAAAQLGEGTPGGIACGLTDGSTASQWRLPTLQCPSGQSCFMSDATGEFNSIFGSACSSAPYVLNTEGTGCWTELHPFSGVHLGPYWSSTSNADYPTNAWFADLYYGIVVGNDSKTAPYLVWPVRGGQ